MVHVRKDMVVQSMDGVERVKIIVKKVMDVNLNLVNVGNKNKIEK